MCGWKAGLRVGDLREGGRYLHICTHVFVHVWMLFIQCSDHRYSLSPLSTAVNLLIDIFDFLFPSVSLFQNRLFITVVTVSILFLCSFFTKSIFCMISSPLAIDDLKYISVLSILSMFSTVCIIFGLFVLNPRVSESVEVFHIRRSLFSSLSILLIPFNCHYNIPRFYYVFPTPLRHFKELKERSPGHMWMTSIGSTSIILCVYFMMACRIWWNC